MASAGQPNYFNPAYPITVKLPIAPEHKVNELHSFPGIYIQPELRSDETAQIELLSPAAKTDLLVDFLDTECNPTECELSDLRSNLGRQFTDACTNELYASLATSISTNKYVIIGRSQMVVETVTSLESYRGEDADDYMNIEDVCPATPRFLHTLAKSGWLLTSMGNMADCIGLGEDIFCLVHPNGLPDLSNINRLLVNTRSGLELGPQMPEIVNPLYHMHWRNWIVTPYPIDDNEYTDEKKWNFSSPIDFSHMSQTNIEYLGILYSRLDLDHEFKQYLNQQNDGLKQKLSQLCNKYEGLERQMNTTHAASQFKHNFRC